MNKGNSLTYIILLIFFVFLFDASYAGVPSNNEDDSESNEKFSQNEGESVSNGENVLSNEELNYLCELVCRSTTIYLKNILRFVAFFQGVTTEYMLNQLMFLARYIETQLTFQGNFKMIRVNRRILIYVFFTQYKNGILFNKLEGCFRKGSQEIFKTFKENSELIKKTLTELIDVLFGLIGYDINVTYINISTELIELASLVLQAFGDLMNRCGNMKYYKFKLLAEKRMDVVKGITVGLNPMVKEEFEANLVSRNSDNINKYLKVYDRYVETGNCEDCDKSKLDEAIKIHERFFKNVDKPEEAVLWMEFLIMFSLDILGLAVSNISAFSGVLEGSVVSDLELKINDVLDLIVSRGTEARVSPDLALAQKHYIRKLIKYDRIGEMNIFPKMTKRSLEKKELLTIFKDFYRSLLELSLKLKSEGQQTTADSYLSNLFTQVNKIFDDYLKIIIRAIKMFERSQALVDNVVDGIKYNYQEKLAGSKKHISGLLEEKEEPVSSDSKEKLEKKKRTKARYEKKIKGIEEMTRLFIQSGASVENIQEREATPSLEVTSVKKEKKNELSRNERKLRKLIEEDERSSKAEEIRRSALQLRAEYLKPLKSRKAREQKTKHSEPTRERRQAQEEDRTKQIDQTIETEGLKVIDAIVNSVGNLNQPWSKSKHKLIALSSQILELSLEDFESDENLTLLSILQSDKHGDSACQASRASPSMPSHFKDLDEQDKSVQDKGADTTQGPRIDFQPSSHSRRSKSRTRHRSSSSSRSRSRSRSRTSTRVRSTIPRRRADEVPRMTAVPTIQLFGESPVFYSRSGESTSRGERQSSGAGAQSESTVSQHSDTTVRQKTHSTTSKSMRKVVRERKKSITSPPDKEVDIFSSEIETIISEMDKLEVSPGERKLSKFVPMFKHEIGKQGKISYESVRSSVMEFLGVDSLEYSLNQNSSPDQLNQAIESTGENIMRIHSEIIPIVSEDAIFYVNLIKNELIKKFISMIILKLSSQPK